jgi:hypothetical protein
MLYFLITSHTCVTTIIIFIMIATIFSNFFLKYDCQVKLQHKAHIITCILKTKPENLIQRMQLYVLKRSIFKWNKTKVDHDCTTYFKSAGSLLSCPVLNTCSDGVSNSCTYNRSLSTPDPSCLWLSVQVG